MSGLAQYEFASTIETIFSDSSEFVVIGLTGRTGSGCSTAARILKKTNLELSDSTDTHYEGNEIKKYAIIKKYIDKNWKPFEWLQIRTIITGYFLEKNFEEFKIFVSKITNISREKVSADLIAIEEIYNEMHLEVEGVGFDSEENEEQSKSIFELYFDSLNEFSNKLRDALKTVDDGAYTKIYQTAGDNIRSSGNAYDDNFCSTEVFSFPKRICDIIGHAYKHSKSRGNPCYIVIDAIRNPFEAIYLKQRYSSFYLFSINTDNENRIKHLKSSRKYTESQIIELDKKEYPESLQGSKIFTSQNIQKCIELSDIHINNPRDDKFGNAELRSQIAWYVSLIFHPGLVMPTSIESCMQIAYSVKKNSGCISRQVGAVVTDEIYSVKTVGWNNTPQGQVPCLLRSVDSLLRGDDPETYSHYERNDNEFRKGLIAKYSEKIQMDSKKNGRNLSFCFKDLQNQIEDEKNQVHTRSLHAEENAFLQIAKFGGQKLSGGILFTTASPCELCAKKAYQIGVSKIIYIDPYPGIATSHILNSGSKSPDMMLFRGAIGLAFHRLYQPLLPYKDELEMLLGVTKYKKESVKSRVSIERQIRDLENKKKELEVELDKLIS